MAEKLQNFGENHAEVNNEFLKAQKLSDMNQKMRDQLHEARSSAKVEAEEPIHYMKERLKLSLSEDEISRFSTFLNISLEK